MSVCSVVLFLRLTDGASCALSALKSKEFFHAFSGEDKCSFASVWMN